MMPGDEYKKISGTRYLSSQEDMKCLRYASDGHVDQ